MKMRCLPVEHSGRRTKQNKKTKPMKTKQKE